MNKVALITGATRGIGKACAQKFFEDGYELILVYNKSQKEAEKIQEEFISKNGIVHLFQVDLSNLDELENFLKNINSNFKKIDVLINNAGTSLQKLLIDTSTDEIDKIIKLNLNAPILLSREISKLMISNYYGRIINISSIWGEIGGSMESVYSASKAGIIGFTKALGKELARCNITVNSISPGAIETDMLKEISIDNLNEFKNEIPINRFGKPEDIANLALFLASENASYITAQNFGVNGGLN